MIVRAKALIARHWPVLRLRTILLGTLLFVAALPGLGAVFLRVYENALVRRTEAELATQGAALGASAAVLWKGPGLSGAPPPSLPPQRYEDRPTEIDLSSSAILPASPPAVVTSQRPDARAQAIALAFSPAFRETKLTTLSSIVMLDRQGLGLNGADMGKSLAAREEVRAALGGRPITVLRLNDQYRSRYLFEWLSRAANIRLHHARPILVDGRVVGAILASRSPRALFRGMYEDRGKIALGVATIFLLLVLLSAVLSRAIVRPIEGLSRATRELASGKRITTSQPSLRVVEIQALYQDFDRMAQSIEKRSRYLRDFAAAVSHEFKTPLAAISGAIELLQDHEANMAPDEKARFFDNMASDAERLSRLVRRLMELARADLLVGDSHARTNAAHVAAEVADALQGDGFHVNVEAPDVSVIFPIDAATLEAVLTILLENARQACARALTIRISRQSAGAWIDIIDDGPGIPRADRLKIFDPFFTSKRDRGGTGMGLAIARSLLAAYQGRLELLASDRGAHFRIASAES